MILQDTLSSMLLDITLVLHLNTIDYLWVLKDLWNNEMKEKSDMDCCTAKHHQDKTLAIESKPT